MKISRRTLSIAKLTKKELANLAINLLDNIDNGDQFDYIDLFYHLDNAYLLYLINDFYETIKFNERFGKDYTTMSEDELEEVLAKARKVLEITEEDEDC